MVNLWPQSFKCVRTDLHVWLNPNQSYRKSAVQWYFPLQVSILQVIIGQLVAVKICSNRRKTTFDKVQVHDNDAYKCYYDRDFMRPFYLTHSVTSKNLPNVYKSCPKNQMKDFDTFTKNCLKMWAIWENNFCHGLWEVAQSAINHPIWSHCLHKTGLEQVGITIGHNLEI